MNSKVLFGLLMAGGVAVAVIAILRSGGEAARTGAELPEGLIVSAIAGEPLVPAEARKTAKAGDEVLLAGTIGGRSRPFVEGRAMFVLTGAGTTACAEACATGCSTGANEAATIQIVDGTGSVIPVSIENHRGLGVGTRLVVRGTVATNQDGAFLITASAIAIAK